MRSLDTHCPECGQPWDLHPEFAGKRAQGFDTCVYQCPFCGIAYSNTEDPQQRVRITRDPELNVPVEVRDGLAEALAGAATVGNRPTKRRKFCSARSEDAVTWTVVRGLLGIGRAGALAGAPMLGEPTAVLTWGHPIHGDAAADLAARLVAVSNDLGEHPDWRSEPDVMVLWPGLLEVIEAKYGSANDSQPGHKAYPAYLKRPELFTADAAAVAKEGSYQLTRNWVIGTALAEGLGVPLRLVNLGPAAIAGHAQGFAALLAQTPQRSFEHRSWQTVLQDAAPLPAWLAAYAQQRQL